jgi:hypothetical protein
MAWETVKACYLEMLQEAERMKKVLGDGPDASTGAAKPPPPPSATTKAITVTRAAKKGFLRTVSSAHW